MKRFFISLIALTLSITSNLVTAAEFKFAYSVPYKSAMFNSKPKAEDLNAAMELASTEVWKKYLLTRPQAELIRLDESSNKSKIESRLSEIVTINGEPQVRIDEKKKLIQIAGRGVVNENLVNVIVGASTRDNRSNQEKVIGFLVMPRLQAIATSYSPETESSVGSSSKNMSESVLNEEISGSSKGVTERVVEGNKTASENTQRSSGNLTRRSQDSEFTLGNVVQVTGALSEAFNNAGFDAYDYSDIAANCGGPSADNVMNAILDRASGDLSGDMRKGVFDATRDKNCLAGEFFILGTIDVDSIELKQGITHASAIVNVQIFDLSRKIPKRIASIDSVRRDGEGSTEDKAVSNAISRATELASNEILSAFSNRQ